MEKAAVFILLGQSNAVGHGTPMEKEDYITTPLKNVFGLHRKDNQSFDIQTLTWSGYQSGGMNLGETQDHTYSLANCLAAHWQERIDGGEMLPDLYILQIAIGAQGVTEKYMWNPRYEKKLIPGKLGTANIALFSLTCHILSLLDKSFRQMGKDYEIMGLHWRGGEEDTMEDPQMVRRELTGIYREIFGKFREILGAFPLVLHGIHCPNRMTLKDPTGRALGNMEYINKLFCSFAKEEEDVSVFDMRKAPFYSTNTKENGIFLDDFIHYTPKANRWAAEKITEKYLQKLSKKV